MKPEPNRPKVNEMLSTVIRTPSVCLLITSLTFLVMVAENKKVRRSRGITFKILSTCQKKKEELFSR